MGFDGILWLLISGLKALTLVGVFSRCCPKVLRGALGGYLSLSLAGDLALFFAFQSGSFSTGTLAYRRVYFGSEAMIAVAGYLVLVRLVELAFERSPVSLPRLRSSAMLVFSGIAVGSGFWIYHLRSRFTLMRFSFTLDQNLSYLAMVLTLVVWVGINLMRVPGLRFRRIVLAFSVLYSAKAVAVAALGLFPRFAILGSAMAVASLFGLCLLAYSILSSPEPGRQVEREAKLADGARDVVAA